MSDIAVSPWVVAAVAIAVASEAEPKLDCKPPARSKGSLEASPDKVAPSKDSSSPKVAEAFSTSSEPALEKTLRNACMLLCESDET